MNDDALLEEYNWTCFCRGDDMRVEEIAREISELDERAKELDKARSQSIQSISYINERNRKNNVEKAEKAIMVEFQMTRS